MINKRILHISDTHGAVTKLWRVAKSEQAFDWIVLTGDLAPTHVEYMTAGPGGFRIIDKEAEGNHQLEWAKNALKPIMDRIPHKHLIIVNGNHDFCDYSKVFPEAITLFKGAKTIEIDGIKVGLAVGVMPIAGEWHEELPNYNFQELLDTLDHEIQVLITHAPAAQVLDLIYDIEHVGYPCLYTKIFGEHDLSDPCFNKLELHLFGHVHEMAGFKEIEVEGRNIVFSNAACQVNKIVAGPKPDMGNKQKPITRSLP